MRLGLVSVHLYEGGNPGFYVDRAADCAAVDQVGAGSADRDIGIVLREDDDDFVAGLRVGLSDHFEGVAAFVALDGASPERGVGGAGLEDLGNVVVDLLLILVEAGDAA